MTSSPLPTPGRNDDGPEGQFRRHATPHLAACLTTGALIIMVILAIHWLG